MLSPVGDLDSLNRLGGQALAAALVLDAGLIAASFVPACAPTVLRLSQLNVAVVLVSGLVLSSAKRRHIQRSGLRRVHLRRGNRNRREVVLGVVGLVAIAAVVYNLLLAGGTPYQEAGSYFVRYQARITALDEAQYLAAVGAEARVFAFASIAVAVAGLSIVRTEQGDQSTDGSGAPAR